MDSIRDQGFRVYHGFKLFKVQFETLNGMETMNQNSIFQNERISSYCLKVWIILEVIYDLELFRHRIIHATFCLPSALRF